jgi:membrane protein
MGTAFFPLIRAFMRYPLPQMAAALAFSTLLALVPLVALVLAVASHLPEFGALTRQIDIALTRALLPGQQGGQVSIWIAELAASADAWANASLAALVSMAFLLVYDLENAFNRIWGVKRGRAWQQRLPRYLVGLLAAPLILGMLTSLSNLLLHLSADWAPHQAILLRAADILIFSVIFALLYYAIPNTRVSRRAAIMGGIILSLLLFAMKEGLRSYVASTDFYARIYGALAALPVFLLWLYLAWLLVLSVGVLVARLDKPTRKSS